MMKVGTTIPAMPTEIYCLFWLILEYLFKRCRTDRYFVLNQQCSNLTCQFDCGREKSRSGVESAKWFYAGFFLRERAGSVIQSEVDCVSLRMNSQTCSGASRFADYFVICGLDLSSGLEPDRFAGELHLLAVFDQLQFKDHPYAVTSCMKQTTLEC